MWVFSAQTPQENIFCLKEHETVCSATDPCCCLLTEWVFTLRDRLQDGSYLQKDWEGNVPTSKQTVLNFTENTRWMRHTLWQGHQDHQFLPLANLIEDEDLYGI